MIRTAQFSPCRTWRYTLEREWTDEFFIGSNCILLFILLNPSTADAEKDDPTNRRGIGFARKWGFGAVVFCNLFAYRTPYPAELKKAADPIGPDNDAHILEQADQAHQIVVAWGRHANYMDRDKAVLKLLGDRYKLQCLGRNQDGSPKHILYLPKDAKMAAYNA